MAKNEFGFVVSSIQKILPHGQVDDGPINWSVLAPAPDPFENVLVPTYGLYGGPNYTGGVVLGPGDTASLFSHHWTFWTQPTRLTISLINPRRCRCGPPPISRCSMRSSPLGINSSRQKVICTRRLRHSWF